MEKKVYILPALFLFFVVALTYESYSKMTQEVFSLSVNKRVVLIDAGHGGWDPGKTGIRGENEKDINLKIAENLQAFLENSGAIVLITRNSDEALGTGKREDLHNRKLLANNSNIDIVVSIHQNAYSSSGIKGAQVFYYGSSGKSKLLAESIQKHMKDFLDPNNKRIAKPNDSYYILKQTEKPAIIVECGFLTNYDEEKKLNTEDYQEKVAWAIYLGINEYFQEEEAAK